MNDIDNLIIPRFKLIESRTQEIFDYSRDRNGSLRNTIGVLRKNADRLNRRIVNIRAYAESRGQITLVRFGVHNEITSVLQDLVAIISERNAEIAKTQK